MKLIYKIILIILSVYSIIYLLAAFVEYSFILSYNARLMITIIGTLICVYTIIPVSILHKES